MDFGRLSRGEAIAALAGLALLALMFVDWFAASDSALRAVGSTITVTAPCAGEGCSAWEAFSFIDIVLLLTVVAAVGMAVLKAVRGQLPLPLAASTVTAGLGILAVIFILFRIIEPVEELDRQVGLYLGLIAALLVALGGWLAMQEEGRSLSGEAERLGDKLSESPGETPAGPNRESEATSDRSD